MFLFNESMFRGAVVAACAVALVACASPYQENGFIGGYDVKDLGQDVFRIRYSGNGYTTQETAQVYWLARAADLTLEKGFASFEILSDMRFSLWQPLNDDGLAPARLAATSAIAPVTVLSDELADASAWRTSGPGAAGDRPAGRIRVAASTFVFIPSGGGGSPHPAIEGDIHLLNRPVEPAPPKVFNARALQATLQPLIKADEKCSFGNVCPHVHEYLLPKGKLLR
jgi:hypothetical protein